MFEHKSVTIKNPHPTFHGTMQIFCYAMLHTIPKHVYTSHHSCELILKTYKPLIMIFRTLT